MSAIVKAAKNFATFQASPRDKETLLRTTIMLLGIACITLGSMAINGGYNGLDTYTIGAVTIGAAALFHLFVKGKPRIYQWQLALVTSAFVALGVLSMLGYIPMLGVAIPLTALGVWAFITPCEWSVCPRISAYNGGERFRNDEPLPIIVQAYKQVLSFKGLDFQERIVKEHLVTLVAVALITLGALALDGQFNTVETGSILIGGTALLHLLVVGPRNILKKKGDLFIAALFYTLGVLSILGYIPMNGVAIPLTAMGGLSLLYLPDRVFNDWMFHQPVLRDDTYTPLTVDDED